MKNDDRDLLRRLAMCEDGAVTATLARGRADLAELTPKTQALVRLAGLIAVPSAAASFQSSVAAAIAAGAEDSEVIAVLVSMAPIVGIARVVAAAPDLALSLGYDVDAALEERSTAPPGRGGEHGSRRGPGGDGR